MHVYSPYTFTFIWSTSDGYMGLCHRHTNQCDWVCHWVHRNKKEELIMSINAFAKLAESKLSEDMRALDEARTVLSRLRSKMKKGELATMCQLLNLDTEKKRMELYEDLKLMQQLDDADLADMLGLDYLIDKQVQGVEEQERKKEERKLLAEMAEQQRKHRTLLLANKHNCKPEGQYKSCYIMDLEHNCEKGVQFNGQARCLIVERTACAGFLYDTNEQCQALINRLKDDDQYQFVAERSDMMVYQRLYKWEVIPGEFEQRDDKRVAKKLKKAVGRTFLHAYRWTYNGWQRQAVFFPKGYGKMPYEEQRSILDVMIDKTEAWVSSGTWN